MLGERTKKCTNPKHHYPRVKLLKEENMRDKEIDLRYNTLERIIEQWNNLRDIYRKIYNEKKLGPEEENAFLKTKEFLAKHYYLVQQLVKEYNAGEERIDIVLAALISVDTIPQISELQIKKIDNDWHITYLSMNRVMGILESKKDKLAHTSAVGLFLKKIFLNPFLNLLVLIVVIIVLYLVSVNVFQLDKILKPVPEEKTEEGPK